MGLAISVLSASAAVAALALGPALTCAIDAASGRSRSSSLRRSLSAAAAGALVWAAVVVLFRPPLDPPLLLPLAGLAAFAAVLAGLPLDDLPAGSQGSFPLWSVVFAGSWTAFVFSPVAIAVLSATDGLLGAGLNTLDLGGALPVLVASGCSSIAILIIERRTPVVPAARARLSALPAFAVVWALWLVWLVGLELVIDVTTARIIASAVIAPLVAAAAWLAVQRVAHARTTIAAAISGLFCGLVAVTAGCGYLDALGSALTGVIAGLLGSTVGYRRLRRTGRPGWIAAVVLTVSGSIGLVLLGAFATRSGIMFTGQPEVLFSQSASALAVVAYSTVVSCGLWIAVRTLEARVTRPVGTAAS